MSDALEAPGIWVLLVSTRGEMEKALSHKRMCDTSDCPKVNRLQSTEHPRSNFAKIT